MDTTRIIETMELLNEDWENERHAELVLGEELVNEDTTRYFLKQLAARVNYFLTKED